MITPRENMLRVFRHEEPEWVPITTVCDNYSRPVDMPEGYFEREGGPSTRALARYLDIELWDRYGAYTETYRNVAYTQTTTGNIRTQRWETPYGVLTSSHQEVRFSTAVEGDPGIRSWAPVEWPVKGLQDYRAFSHIIENTQYDFHPEDVASRLRELGERGILAITAPSSPLGMCVRNYMGVETLGIEFCDHPTELRDLLERIADKYYEAYRGIAQTAGDAAINYDDTTTHAISPTMFRELEVPYLNQTADILHANSKFLIHHACGHVLALLDDMRRVRMDVLDGPYAPPVGNVPVTRAREGLGPDIAITLPTNDEFLQSGNPDAIRAYVRSLYEEAGYRRNLTVCIVPPAGGRLRDLWVAIDEAKRLSHQGPRRWHG